MIISDYIAIGSLVIAAVALWRTWRTERRIEKRDRQARIRVRVERIDSSRCKLIICNIGGATARNVRLLSDEIDFGDGSDRTKFYLVKGMAEPIATITEGAGVEKILHSKGTRTEPPTVTITWEDDCDKRNKYHQTLSI